jgi:hypothetical protein
MLPLENGGGLLKHIRLCRQKQICLSRATVRAENDLQQTMQSGDALCLRGERRCKNVLPFSSRHFIRAAWPTDAARHPKSPTDAARCPKSPTDARAKERQEHEHCEVEVWVRGEEERRQEEGRHAGPRREWELGAAPRLVQYAGASSGPSAATRQPPWGLGVAETPLPLPNPGSASSHLPIHHRWGSMSRLRIETTAEELRAKPPTRSLEAAARPQGSAARPLVVAADYACQPMAIAHPACARNQLQPFVNDISCWRL